jgi:hypothetical protein
MREKNSEKLNKGRQVKLMFDEMHRQEQRKQRFAFFARLIGYPLVFIIFNGSFFWLIDVIGIFKLGQDLREGLLSYVVDGVIVIAYGLYLLIFLKGFLYLSEKLGLKWIFFSDY